MPGVYVPQAQQGAEKTLLPIAGSVVGGMVGGPVGAAVGGKLGGELVKGGGSPGAVETSAIDRRLDSIQGDPSVQLAQADAALKQMPPEYQQQYGPTIQAARQRDLMGGVA